MEIRLQQYYHSLLIQFKIDLIVWKLPQMSSLVCYHVVFKIDLIVWKLGTHTPADEFLRSV